MTQDKRTFYPHWNHLIPFYPDKRLLFLHNESYNGQNPVTTPISDTSDVLQIDLDTSFDASEKNDFVFDDVPLCDEADDASNMLDIELHKPVNLDDVKFLKKIKRTFWKSIN